MVNSPGARGPSMTPPRRRLALEGAILDLAAAAFAADGYQAVRIEHVDMLFATKFALYNAVLQREICKLSKFLDQGLVRRAEKGPADATEAGVAAVEHIFDYFNRRPCWLPLLLGATDWRLSNELHLEARDRLHLFIAESLHGARTSSVDRTAADLVAKLIAVSTVANLELVHTRKSSSREARHLTLCLVNELMTQRPLAPRRPAP